jgi:uncharacterized protein (UPF0261 family)
MKGNSAIIVLGTFDSKGEEHLFLKNEIEKRGLTALTIHVGTKGPSPFVPDFDLFAEMGRDAVRPNTRDEAIADVIRRAKDLVSDLYKKGRASGIISAGGGTGTHLATSVMRVLPLGVPKVMVSTVASRDMSQTVGTKDITMMHSVADLLGVNSISGIILDKGVAAVCSMAESRWAPTENKKKIGMTMFGFITEGAEHAKRALEGLGYEVIAFHANGTGGMAMEELAREGYFDGILDLATHELADELMKGYCKGIGPERLMPPPDRTVPRVVVPGGLDCAVLEFTRDTVPPQFADRKLFFYDFRSAIRLSGNETEHIARQLVEKLNRAPVTTKVLIPALGWSEADRKDGPLYDPPMASIFVEILKQGLNPKIEVLEKDLHINDAAFAEAAAHLMDEMVSGGRLTEYRISNKE